MKIKIRLHDANTNTRVRRNILITPTHAVNLPFYIFGKLDWDTKLVKRDLLRVMEYRGERHHAMTYAHHHCSANMFVYSRSLFSNLVFNKDL